jgi:DNA-binding transcriptional MerR regulator
MMAGLPKNLIFQEIRMKTNPLDKALNKEVEITWYELLQQARDLGLSTDQVRQFLKKEENVYNYFYRDPKQKTDSSWYELILHARNIGLSIEEVRQFLRR